MDLPLENPDTEMFMDGTALWIKDNEDLNAKVTHQLLSIVEDTRNYTVQLPNRTFRQIKLPSWQSIQKAQSSL